MKERDAVDLALTRIRQAVFASIPNPACVVSLGLMVNPQNKTEVAIQVCITGDNTSGIPQSITLDGRTYQVFVITNYQTPTPL